MPARRRPGETRPVCGGMPIDMASLLVCSTLVAVYTLPAQLVVAKGRGRRGRNCVGWKQTGGCDPFAAVEGSGNEVGCDARVPEGASGFCDCGKAGHAGFVNCDHSPFTCRDVCNRDAAIGYLENTEWHWNNWRDVEFRAGGEFFAPEPNCENGGCKWSVHGDVIDIEWASAGKHSVRLSSDRKRLEGQRFDGDPCSGDFRRRNEDAGAKRVSESRTRNGVGKDGNLAESDEDEDSDDLYTVLGVDPDSSEGAVKKAFRRLSRKYHPDKNRNDPDAAAMFEKVREAYEVVGDPDKRILYDTGGIEAVREAEKQDAAGGQAMDPFAAFFGGGGQQQGRKAKKGSDYRVELTVSLRDMYVGNTVAPSISRRVVCRGCKNGGKGKHRARCSKCGRCPNEIRMVTRQMAPGFQVQQQEEVPSKHRCRDETVELDAVVERGMRDGSELTFERMSEQRPGQIPGDIIVVLKQDEHPRFRRDGDDLHYEMHISLKEALVGFSHNIQHLDGHEVEVSSNGRITKPFQVMRIKDEGMPVHEVPSNFGNLYVKIIVDFPAQLSEEQKEFVRNNF